ncbi:hypothetical protein Tco_0904026, partial [Tanacetum coccineum]
ETVTKEKEDRIKRVATTASSLEAEQDSEAQTRFETASKQSNNPPLSRVNTHKGGEDRLKLKELMDLCTKLSDRVLDLETTKAAQAKEIASLKKRVKKLERKKEVISVAADEVPTGDTVNTVDMEVNTASAPVTTAGVSVSTTEPITTASINITAAEPITPPPTTTVFEDEDLTIAQTLVKMRSEKSKTKEKGKMVEQEKPLKKKGQIKFDEEITQRLQAQMQAEQEEEERLAREREEDVNIAEWDNTQAMMDVDYELAARIQVQEQEELTIKEKSRLFVELMDKRKKHFVRLRAEVQRRKPLTKAQKRNQMCTYLKNIVGFTHNQLKNKSFDEVQKAFNKTMSWINSFVPVDSEVVKEREDLQQESAKKQKMDDDKEKEELKKCFEIVPDDGDDVTIDATPLFVKIPIVDYKIYLEGKKSFFQIIKADGKTQMYLTFSKMLKNFDREDLEVLWRINKD